MDENDSRDACRHGYGASHGVGSRRAETVDGRRLGVPSRSCATAFSHVATVWFVGGIGGVDGAGGVGGGVDMTVDAMWVGGSGR